MANGKQVEITEKYKKELEAELEFRKNAERERILTAIAEAKSQGDLSENADYSSAREAQSINEARITELEETLKHARIVQVVNIEIEYVALKKKMKYII